MPIHTRTCTDSVAGLSIQSVTTRNAATQFGTEVALPAGAAGSLSTRGGDTEGELTMDDAGHGIQTGDTIAIFWAGGRCFNCTVGTVAGTTVPFTTAVGDVLPAADTVVVADVQVEHNLDFDGDNLESIVANCTRRGHIHFEDSGGNVLAGADLTAAESWQWFADQGIANPLAGNPVDKVFFANGDGVNAATAKLGMIYDSAV